MKTPKVMNRAKQALKDVNDALENPSSAELTPEQKEEVLARVSAQHKEEIARQKRIDERASRINAILSEEPKMTMVVSGQFMSGQIIQTRIEIKEIAQQ